MSNATGGMSITQGAITTLVGLASIAITTGVTSKSSKYTPQKATGIYRPPEWKKKSVYSIVVPKSSVQDAVVGVPITNMDADGNPIINIQAVGSLMYVFDAVLVANHASALQPTQYPVQSGYNQSYNAVLMPKRLTLEVAMSDAMDTYESGMWTGNISKSVSAFQEMQSLQQNRAFLTLNTRQQTYYNMMLVGIDSPETNKTIKGAKMLLTFEQIFVGNVAIQTISSRPNATGDTNLATVQSTNAPTSANTNNLLPSVVNNSINETNLENTYGTPLNAGNWSSNNTTTIPTTLGGS